MTPRLKNDFNILQNRERDNNTMDNAVFFTFLSKSVSYHNGGLLPNVTTHETKLFPKIKQLSVYTYI